MLSQARNIVLNKHTQKNAGNIRRHITHLSENLSLNGQVPISSSLLNNKIGVNTSSIFILNSQKKLWIHSNFKNSKGCLGIVHHRGMSTESDKKDSSKMDDDTSKENSQTKTTTDLRDSVNRMKSKDGKNDTSEETQEESSTDSMFSYFGKVTEHVSTFSEEVGKTWQELIGSNKPKGINKKIINNPTAPIEDYDGPTDLMMIDESEHLSAFEKMQRRLSEAPIIQDILGKTHEIYEKSGAKQAKQKMDDISEDAKEAWETSQNPWVYRMSSVYDTMTAETDMAIATRELQKLDPQFTMEQFKNDAVEHTIPDIMQHFLEGRINELKPWLGEAVYKRLTAENKVRKDEGLIVDSNLLGIFNCEIVAVEMDKVDKQPIILMHFMAQQINCVRNKEGEVVEGREDDIKANSYLLALQREYVEEEGALNWKIVDFRFNGAIAWI